MANHDLQNTSKIIRNVYISLQNFRLISGPMLPLFPRMEKTLENHWLKPTWMYKR